MYRGSLVKEQDLWDRVTGAAYPWLMALPGEHGAWLSERERRAMLADAVHVAPAFLHQHEVLAEPRVRALHTYGAVARIRWTPSGEVHPFTGLFRGRASGLLRVSLAKAYLPLEDGASVTPGLSVLFPVTNGPAVSLLLNVSIEGQGDDTNLWRGLDAPDGSPTGVFRNWLAPPPAGSPEAAAAARFQQHLDGYAGEEGRQQALVLPNDPLARVDPQSGGWVSGPVVPAAVEWAFPDVVRESWPSEAAALASLTGRVPASILSASEQLGVDFRRALALWSPPADGPFARIYARAELEGGERFHVADVTLRSGFVASSFGDERLHFRHPFRGLA